MRPLRRMLLTALVAFCAALAAIFLARAVTPAPSASGSELHHLIHEELGLDATQARRIAELEGEFAIRRRTFDASLRRSNAALAAAMAREKAYGPAVAEAVDRSHHAMGELQKATLEHVFAMRSVLRPDQAMRFDQEVRKALTRASEP